LIEQDRLGNESTMSTTELNDQGPTSETTFPPRPVRGMWPRYLLAAAVVAAVAGFYFTGLGEYFSWETIRANVDEWQARVAQNLLSAIILFFCVYTVVTALSLPAAAAMTLLAGALFGRFVGTAVVSVASTSGAMLAFLGSRYLFRDSVQTRYADRLRGINEGIQRDGAYYLFMLRLVPLVPFFLINLGMGLTTMRIGTYVVTSWLGMLVGTFLYVNAGTAIATIESPSGVLSPTVLISLAALGVVPIIIRKLSQWRAR
jgi:uncharacterized membrane protein YdjX (TVP38/TMEM64 family)